MRKVQVCAVREHKLGGRFGGDGDTPPPSDSETEREAEATERLFSGVVGERQQTLELTLAKITQRLKDAEAQIFRLVSQDREMREEICGLQKVNDALQQDNVRLQVQVALLTNAISVKEQTAQQPKQSTQATETMQSQSTQANAVKSTQSKAINEVKAVSAGDGANAVTTGQSHQSRQRSQAQPKQE